MLPRKVPAGEFKAKCLKMMDQVQKTGVKITVTKRNIPIAQLVPIDKREAKLFGKLQGTVHISKNIIDPIDEEWDADT